MQIINCRQIKTDILENIKKDVLTLPFDPVFCDILVGSDVVSQKYVDIKARTAQSVGMKFKAASFKEDATTADLVEEIERLNKVPYICGIIVQLPLPIHIDRQTVLDAIAPGLDVDCLGAINNELFYQENHSDNQLGYPTALACIRILDSLNLNLENKSIVVLGQGTLVGRPVAHLLEMRGLTVIRVDKNTVNIAEILKDADVIISGIGRAKFITASMIKEGVVIIDAGTSEEDGAIVGDLDIESVEGLASFVTSSPGGVGPVTVAMLLENVLKVGKERAAKNLEAKHVIETND